MPYKIKKKGQVSVEMIIVTVIVFVIFLYVFGIFNDNIRDINGKRLEFKAKEIGDDVANGINSAYLSGDGSKLNILLPNRINSKDYNVKILPNIHLVEVKMQEFLYTAPIITSDINNTVIQNKELRLSNLNGKIFIQQ
ncbi:hypothetical protein J4214_05555 [Candidatus Woesearchaeota archaeon]|nr:hypothetical protein [Candidatus Woesearchaeota archaeon]